jgi:hypothetical protein
MAAGSDARGKKRITDEERLAEIQLHMAIRRQPAYVYRPCHIFDLEPDSVFRGISGYGSICDAD